MFLIYLLGPATSLIKNNYLCSCILSSLSSFGFAKFKRLRCSIEIGEQIDNADHMTFKREKNSILGPITGKGQGHLKP